MAADGAVRACAERIVRHGGDPCLRQGKPFVDVGHRVLRTHAVGAGRNEVFQLVPVGVDETFVVAGDTVKHCAGGILRLRRRVFRIDSG